MQSKIWSFNPTLFRKNLTRFWPLWGGASFVGALFPLALLLTSLQRHRYPSALDFAQGCYGVVSVVLPILSLIYAILCAMVVWGYLYNARSVGMMHTLPIRREGVFCTTFLSGMAMMLIPYTVVGLLCLLISLLFGALDPVVFAVTALAVIGESLFYFASATFTALVVGNIFALPAVYLLLHFLAMILEWLIAVLAQGFLFGVTGGYEAVAEWLSPTMALERHVTVENVYTEQLVEQGRPFSIAFIDLDRFKSINDTYGHMTGDWYLKHFTQEFIRHFSDEGALYRIAGDEFVYLREEEPGAEAVLKSVCSLSIAPLAPDIPFLGFSCGGGSFPADAKTADELLAVADSRMYQAKMKARAVAENTV